MPGTSRLMEVIEAMGHMGTERSARTVPPVTNPAVDHEFRCCAQCVWIAHDVRRHVQFRQLARLRIRPASMLRLARP